jgi:hypothetical protein
MIKISTFIPHSEFVAFFMGVRTISDHLPTHYQLTGFHNPEELCLLRGTS